MFSHFANLIRCSATSAVLLALSASNFAADSTIRGGALNTRTNDVRRQFTLTAKANWQLNITQRFDASALAFRGGKLITVNDRDGVLYELELQTNSVAALKRLDLFPRPVLARVTPKKATRFDFEGIAVDPAGNIYVSEESQRLVFKSSSDGKHVDALAFDWSPVERFISNDINASLEGIAVLGDRLFLANERSAPRIFVIDLPSRKIIDSFAVDSLGFAFGGAHYSDLSVFEGHLFILDRNHRCIFEVDPISKRVLAEYSFAQMELTEDVAYYSDYPTGAMEGLAIDRDYFWLLTDNNGKARFKHPKDNRPTLFQCPRPLATAPKR